MADSLAGRRTTCPKCGATVTIPAALEPVPVVPPRVRRRWLAPGLLFALMAVTVAAALHLGGDRPGAAGFRPVPIPETGKAPAPAQLAVAEWLGRYADDPESVEVIEWLSPVPTGRTGLGDECDTAVAATIRMRNEAGVKTVDSYMFYLKDGRVIARGREGADPLGFRVEMNRLYHAPIPADPLGEQIRQMADRPFVPEHRKFEPDVRDR